MRGNNLGVFFHKRLFLFFAIGLLSALLLRGSSTAWARPGMQPDHQTVPTLPPTQPPYPTLLPTRIPSPTPTSTSEPISPRPTTTPAFTPPASLDLQVLFYSSVNMVIPGQVFHYTINIKNPSPIASGSLVIRDPLPMTLEILNVQCPRGQVHIQDNLVIVKLETIPGGENLQIEIYVRVKPDLPAGTWIENHIEVEHTGRVWRSAPVILPLPPAELPLTGGT